MTSRFKYCPVCGGKLELASVDEAERNVCQSCGRINFENPIVGVAAILVDKHGKILMVKRAATASYAGLWCIPCGYVEYSEDIHVAIVREVKEETGLDVVCGEVFAVHSNFHNPSQHTVGIWFSCSVVGGEAIAGDDASEIGWFEPTYPPPLAFPTDYLVLQKIAALQNSINQ